MIWLVFERASGLVLTHLIADEQPSVLSHHYTIETDAIPSDYRLVKIIDGEIVAQLPDGFLNRGKAKIAAKIDAAREERLASGATTPLGIVQADDRSRINISGAVSLAQLDPTNFALPWRLADNTTVTLTAVQMIQVGQLVGAFVSQTYAKSFAFKDALAAITTVDELVAFTFTFE